MSGPLGKFLQRQVGRQCPYCGHPMLPHLGRAPTRDHVFPKCKGFDLASNKAIVCKPCNSSKKHYDVCQWLLRLKLGNDRRAVHVEAFIISRGIRGAPPEPIVRLSKNRRTSPEETAKIVANWQAAWDKIEALHHAKEKTEAAPAGPP